MFSVVSTAFVTFSTIVIFLLSAGLTFFIVRKYLAKKQLNLLYWSSGLIVFTLAVLLEILMANNIYNRFIIDFYLFLVAVLVQFLALGSFALFGNKKFLNYYYIYSVLATIFLIATLVLYPVGDIIRSHIVFGVLPLGITLSSSAGFPSSITVSFALFLLYMQALKISEKSVLNEIDGLYAIL